MTLDMRPHENGRSHAEQDEDSRASLTSRIYARLRDDIIAGRLAPGSKLKIEDLRKRYESGASPIREALSLLSANLLVERLDQRGFRVAPISLAEFDELLKTRCWLEERALRESIANGDSRWEESIVIAAYRLSRVPRAEDAEHGNEEWERQHKNFHMALLSHCGSRILLNTCNELYDQNVRYRQAALPAAYPVRDVRSEHDAIVDAVLERNADMAVERLIHHYTATGTFLRQHLK